MRTPQLPAIPIAENGAQLGDFSTQRTLSEASFDTDSCSYLSSEEDDGLFDDIESEYDADAGGPKGSSAKALAEEEAFHRHLDDVKRKVEHVPNVDKVTVELTFDPPWNNDMLTDEAKLELGML